MQDITSALAEYEPEMDTFEAEQYDSLETVEGEGDFSEIDEMELAADLLGVTNEAEMEGFLGNVWRRFRQFAGSPTGRQVGGWIRNIARRNLPTLGRAVGTALAGPGGGDIGSQLAAGAGQVFGLELEGLSPEDQEFEVARRVVRLAVEAGKNAAQAAPGADPKEVARRALLLAAKKHAPGLLRRLPPATGAVTPAAGAVTRGEARRCSCSGYWRRLSNNRIVLEGVV